MVLVAINFVRGRPAAGKMKTVRGQECYFGIMGRLEAAEFYFDTVSRLKDICHGKDAYRIFVCLARNEWNGSRMGVAGARQGLDFFLSSSLCEALSQPVDIKDLLPWVSTS